MSIDVVMPNNNEAALLEMAEKLGFTELILLYSDLNVKPQKPDAKKIKVLSAGLLRSTNEADKVQRNFDTVFAPAQRSFFENKRVSYLMNAELISSADSLAQKKAGLDDAICKLAKENKQTLVFNTQLLARKGIAGRMLQNAILCRKHKLKFLVASFATQPFEMRAPQDLKGFAKSIKLF